MGEYSSRFAAYMSDMVEYRVALGYSEKTYAPRLRQLDRFIAEKYPETEHFSRDLVMDWITKSSHKEASIIHGRIGIARLFAEYMVATGCDAYILPKNFIRKKHPFSPHIFSDHELTNLFKEIDRIPTRKEDSLKRCTASVLLRLIYTCGLRPGEGLYLKNANVNLDTGEMLITEAKLKKDRMVVLSADMLKLMRKYSMQVKLAGREQSTYYFPKPDGCAYSHGWLLNIVQSCFRRANANIPTSELPRVRIYDLRHRFASAILCKWLDEGKTSTTCCPICVLIWDIMIFPRRRTISTSYRKIC